MKMNEFLTNHIRNNLRIRYLFKHCQGQQQLQNLLLFCVQLEDLFLGRSKKYNWHQAQNIAPDCQYQ